jgi:hypothetical protein
MTKSKEPCPCCHQVQETARHAPETQKQACH